MGNERKVPVRRAEDWLWSSLATRPVTDGLLKVARLRLGRWPQDANWRKAVNAPLEIAQMDLLRRSVVRGTPFGLQDWTAAFAAKTGMESTLRPRGRPRKLGAGEG